MTITPTTLTRAAGLAAVAAGTALPRRPDQPPADRTSRPSRRRSGRSATAMKALMSALALAGITGMYLRQVRQTGVLGLRRLPVFGAGYLVMLGIEFVAAFVLPSLADDRPRLRQRRPRRGHQRHASIGDIGLLEPAHRGRGIGYLAGGLFFGIALFRAGILARWAAALLALAALRPSPRLLPRWSTSACSPYPTPSP